jgi:hypothetical protein
MQARTLSPPSTSPTLLWLWLSVAQKVRLSVTVIRDNAGKNSLTALHKSNAPLVMALCGSKSRVVYDSQQGFLNVIEI